MKTNRPATCATLITAFGLVTFSPGMFAQTDEPMLPPSNAVIHITVTPPGGPLLAQLSTSSAGSDTATVQWSDIKDCTYDMRTRFFDGFKRLEARVDDQISELNAKRATMNSSANTKDWDFAMKEMVDARSYLKSTGEELSNASPETWNQQKDKVGLAWVRTQDAYAKVKSSTTN